jgi:membrane-associated phospholipid phosphatase
MYTIYNKETVHIDYLQYTNNIVYNAHLKFIGIGFENVSCGPKDFTDLKKCHEITAGNELTKTCCDVARAASDFKIIPFQRVPIDSLMMISFVIPIIVILLRTYLWSWFFDSYISSNISSNSSSIIKTLKQDQKWLYRLLVQESVVGLFIALGYEIVMVSVFKEFVSAPRPIFMTLQNWALASVHMTQEAKNIIMRESVRSFPSGHSSLISCAMMYCCLILSHDLSVVQRYAQSLDTFTTGGSSSCVPQSSTNASVSTVKIYVISRCLMFLRMALGIVAFYVGATRIIDHWHFPHDVIGNRTYTNIITVHRLATFYLFHIFLA